MEIKKTTLTKQDLIKIFKKSIDAKLDEFANQDTDEYQISDTDVGILLNFTADAVDAIYQAFIDTHNEVKIPIVDSTCDPSCDNPHAMLDNEMNIISNSYIVGIVGESSHFIKSTINPCENAINRFEGGYSKVYEGYQQAKILADKVAEGKELLKKYTEFKEEEIFKMLQKEINSALKTLCKFTAKSYSFSKTRDGVSPLRFQTEPLISAIEHAKNQGELLEKKKQEEIERKKREAKENEILPTVQAIAKRLNSVCLDDYSYNCESDYYSTQSGMKFIKCESVDFDKCAVVTLSDLINALNGVENGNLLDILKNNQIVSIDAHKVLIIDNGYVFSDASTILSIQKLIFDEIFITESVKNKLDMIKNNN